MRLRTCFAVGSMLSVMYLSAQHPKDSVIIKQAIETNNKNVVQLQCKTDSIKKDWELIKQKILTSKPK